MSNAAPRRPIPTAGGGWQIPDFPFCAQTDNGPEGWRQCQTSSIAMALRYLGTMGIRDDLDYLRIVNRYGDTTAQQSHVLALKALGVDARFRQNITVMDAFAQIKAGFPVVAGVLHHGPASKPTGGGHYICLYGFTGAPGSWLVHDPYGELDLVRGGWTKQGGGAGRGRQYSFANLNPRWQADGPGSGWGWVFG
jgi:hypothetical protein